MTVLTRHHTFGDLEYMNKKNQIRIGYVREINIIITEGCEKVIIYELIDCGEIINIDGDTFREI